VAAALAGLLLGARFFSASCLVIAVCAVSGRLCLPPAHHTRCACLRCTAPPGAVLQARIQAAQYAHLPLSTIGADWIIDAADALFARQLRECMQS
jgi:hypothetical protein